MDWWHFTVGLAGVVGVVGEGFSNWGSWLVGLAFLLLMVRGFTDKG